MNFGHPLAASRQNETVGTWLGKQTAIYFLGSSDLSMVSSRLQII